ncbi:MAG: pyruvate carboxylase subunit B, partial [Candidatus Omnitrophica bacterium]|nr:pyruvate carboxylase subunit B [Candidatus Omnitrophota bacterium]
MYIKEIKDMINLMNENNLTELEIEKEGVRIRLKKGSSGVYEKAIEFAPRELKPSPSENQAKAMEAPEKTNVVEVKAPMVGTFYRAASPDAPPYVNIGDVIEQGQV